MNVKRLLTVLASSTGLVVASWLTLFSFTQAAPSPKPLLMPGNPVTDPVSNTHMVALTASVSITYDEDIDPTTVSTQTFAVHAMQTGLLSQVYMVNKGTIRLSPSQPFKPGELVQVSATTSTVGLISGQGPLTPTVWQFRTVVGGGTGKFVDGAALGNFSSEAVALGDLNGDGHLDAFVGNNTTASSKVWINDGQGNFSEKTQSLVNSNTRAIAVGDLDGDGDLDAFEGNFTLAANRVWINDGQGNFSAGVSLGSSNTSAVALGDVDGDGDLDALAGNTGTDNRIWLNNGDGSFSSGQSFDNLRAQAVALGDVDGDSDLDAVVVNGDSSSDPSRVWFNNGAGNFSLGQTLSTTNGFAVALGDVDDDNDPDIIVGNRNSFGESSHLWLNNGNGNFSFSTNLSNGSTRGIALGDIDMDGDLDLYVGNQGAADEVWINDGVGNFTNTNQSLLSGNSGRAVVLGDLDGDGDLDAFTTSSTGVASQRANKIWLNQNKAEIQVVENTTHIPNNSAVQFGPTVVGSPISKTFTVSNTGETELSLTEPITVPSGFSVINSFGDTTLTGGEQTTFIVQLDATSAGTFSGTLAFANNDADENPFNFIISGTVKTPPEIQVVENTTHILNNSAVQFGPTVVGSAISKTFTVSNTGETELSLTEPITVPSGFSVINSFGDTTLTGGEQTTFIVQLDATSAGTFSGTLAFANNDADENPFSFIISGTVKLSSKGIYLPIVLN